MRLKKILAILLTAVLLVSSTVIALPVSAEEINIESVTDWNATLKALGENGLDISSKLEGAGTAQSPYLIATASDLIYVAVATNNYNKDTTSGQKAAANAAHYKMTADIDLFGVDWYGIGDPWGTTFSGTFDGDGHVIYNFKLAGDQAINGLFRKTSAGAVIKNVGIASGASVVTATSKAHLGNLIGLAVGTLTVSNCFNAASLEANVSTGDASFFGGLVGHLESGASTKITDCWNTGDITLTMDSAKNVGVGGMVGRLNDAFSMEACYSICDIKVGSVKEWDGIGSLIGKPGAGGKEWSVTDCSVGGTLTVTTAVNNNEFTGLLVGDISGTPTWSNCTYSVTGTKNGVDIELLAGDGTEIQNVTSVDKVKIASSTAFVDNYAQNGTVGETRSNSVRFVSELAFSTAAFTKTGFEVKVTYDGSTTEAFPLEGTVVYKSLSVGEGTVTPENGKYFIAYGISDIPADANATFEVTPFVVTLGGDTIYGTTSTVEMTNGDVPEV